MIAHERAFKEMSGYTENFKERVYNSFKREPEIQEQLTNIEIVLPDVTFTDSARLKYGGREVQLIYVGGHTPATSIAWLPEEKIAFVGDILWVDQHPYMAQANSLEWINALRRIRSLGAEILVPGHGPICGPDDTKTVEQYILYKRQRVLDYYREGKTKNEAKSGLVGEMLELFPVPLERKAKIESQIKSGINRVYREIQREEELGHRRVEQRRVSAAGARRNPGAGAGRGAQSDGGRCRSGRPFDWTARNERGTRDRTGGQSVMAYSVREERQSLATDLRDDLAEAERMIVQLRRENVESFLQLLDNIEDRFAQLESSGLDLRTEQTRWGSLLSKLRGEAGRVMRVLDVAGGLKRLRQANPPAQGMWWHLDAVVAAARRRFIRRLGTAVGTITALLAIVWALLTFVFPPDPNAVVSSEAMTTLHQLTFEQRWEEALSVIEVAKEKLTQPDVELLIWEGVIRDKLGQSERAQQVLAEAKDLVPSDQLVAYWWTLGTTRHAVGDLEEARIAGNEALAQDPSNPQGYFLLGSLAEAEGDTGAALDYFEQTFQLAIDTNSQLAVIARVRMGNLLQRPPNMSIYSEDQPSESEGGDSSESE